MEKVAFVLSMYKLYFGKVGMSFAEVVTIGCMELRVLTTLPIIPISWDTRQLRRL